MRFPLTGLVIGLFLVGAIGSGAPYGYSEPPEETVATFGLDLHAPILIEGDEDFIPANGVTGGSGTVRDPYVIQGWRIEQYPRGQRGSIDIRGTLSPFIIRNVYIENSTIGINLENVTSGLISDVTVTEAFVSWGVYLERSRNITITDSRVVSRSLEGIRVWFSEDVRVIGNLMEGNRAGLGVYGSSNLTITGNDIVSNRLAGAYLLLGTTNVVFQGNTVGRHCCTDEQLGPGLPGGAFGLWVNDATGVRVHHNDFVGNQIQARDDGGSENSWDDGYLSGGNYWSDYLGTDVCSGPGQNTCEGGDGFLDAPYLVDSNTIDRYPLQIPNDPSNRADTSFPGLAFVGLGVIAAVAVVLLVFLFLRRRRAELSQEETPREEGEARQS